MTNGEIRMTNQTANPNDETVSMSSGGRRAVSSWLFRHSFVIRASGFVIPPDDIGIDVGRLAWGRRIA
jgi:hypothetical protein